MSPASKAARTARKKSTSKKATRKTSRKKTAARKPTARRKSTAKAGAKKPAPARRKSRLAPKKRLAAVLEHLDRIFGSIELLDSDCVLERAVYLILREQSSRQATHRALKSLREDFVDWNEVRVSRPSELSRLMSATSRVSTLRRFEERSRRVREMINQIYNDRNEPTMEFLLGERARAQFEYLEDLDDLGLHNAYALVQWLSGEDKLVLVSSEMARATQRLGISDTAAVTKVRKLLSAMVPGEQLVTVQAHLNQLGNLEPEAWPTALKEFVV